MHLSGPLILLPGWYERARVVCCGAGAFGARPVPRVSALFPLCRVAVKRPECERRPTLSAQLSRHPSLLSPLPTQNRGQGDEVDEEFTTASPLYNE
jgi:hypothetical protein